MVNVTGDISLIGLLGFLGVFVVVVVSFDFLFLAILRQGEHEHEVGQEGRYRGPGRSQRRDRIRTKYYIYFKNVMLKIKGKLMAEKEFHYLSCHLKPHALIKHTSNVD